ncbi:phenol hydroxylase [Pseudomonas sp. Y39-6]|uniref:aromatic/alkene monooxygenase hydroxylase subunit beta n=1 Tax=Pseudomonas sp. Y39-6 TaxID=2749807 RepID=UPI001910E690|nr:aromatic/alkene monooxygenase hydroxylase subunit beta [Pseudomonas sp. Y39-6]QPO21747.1 phenol hydroxylase [Pseudomonas sp. Y39-6]URS59005.1 aromatic/alkene monooxygenase hydroxylase subunit beta [Pseudomonas sp. Y39-6]
MSVEIKTTTAQTLRNTFSHTRRRFGDKVASRYQEASFDLESATNFHYWPLWQPDKLLNDATRTAVVMADWYVVSDPRQYYYGSYVQARARMQENAEHDYAFCEKRDMLAGLSSANIQLISKLLLPLRHAEMGANMNNSNIAADGFGTSVTQMHMFHAVDRLGIAQYLSRIGLMLDDGDVLLLAQAKQQWLSDLVWQGMRRYVEDTLVVRDWFELTVAQNLVSDGLVYPLLFHKLDEQLSANGAGQVGMLTEFMRLWFAESQRWVDAMLKTVINESAANKDLVQGWVNHWSQRSVEALQPLTALGLDESALDSVCTEFAARLKKIGLTGANV